MAIEYAISAGPGTLLDYGVAHQIWEKDETLCICESGPWGQWRKFYRLENGLSFAMRHIIDLNENCRTGA